ncbi:ABC transporter permease [Desulfospira joergensenii]|uniref:ABC transporter permease n=1 Tax=Desulfospira joergensenii TaxID=53329 RepID=UPI0003B3B045|nr:FtsX-like permease family protein [Desulfospira joergensenii]
MSFAFWIKTAGAFLFRSGRTTFVLGIMICLAVGTLVFISAVAMGVNDCMILNSTALYSGQISGHGLPRSLSREDLFTRGVSNVLERFEIRGVIESRGKTQAIILVALDPARERKSTFLWKKITAGRYLLGDGPNILISRTLAKDFGVGPGDPLVFRAGTASEVFPVAGIYETGIPSLDTATAFCPRSLSLALPGEWSAAVFLEPGISEERIKQAWAANGVDVSRMKTWQETLPDLTQLIDLNRISMGFVLVLVLGVVAFATASAFAIFIVSRIREYGIMKAMGVTPRETAMLIFFQVVLLNLAAALAGTLAGAGAVFLAGKTGIDLSGFTSHNRYFVVSGTIFPRLTPFSLLLPSALALAFCLAAAVWPIFIVVRKRTADVLRSV